MKYAYILSILSLIAVTVILFQFKDVHEELADSIRESAKWESDYNTAKQVAEDNRKALEELQIRHSTVLSDLEEWYGKQMETEEQLNSALKKVHELERDNERVRTTLSTTIPCELWKQIFPATSRCPR